MSVSVVVVGFGDEPVLDSCLRSVLEQVGPRDDVVLVDHGITSPPSIEGVTVVTPPTNTGFGGGCAAGVAASKGDVLVFVNSDAELRPGALAALAARVADPLVGLAGGLILLPGAPDTVNSVGLPVHLSGLSWCDGYGEPLTDRHLMQRRLASVAGALFACRRGVWDSLGGMDESYFMYHEDTDLSLRCHLGGLDVVYCPDAVAVHAYDFSRNPDKMFYLERNRVLTVLADYPTTVLARVLPLLLLLEPLFLVIAVRDGWAWQKLRAWAWLIRHGGVVRSRRGRVQAAVSAPHALDAVLSPTITQTQLDQPGAMSLLNGLLRAYWWAIRPRPRVNRRRPGRPDVVVLRTNPRDSSLARLLTILVVRYRVLGLVWDRSNDYRCPLASPNLTLVPSIRPGNYGRLRTVITVAGLQPWFLWRTLRARPHLVHAMDLDTGVVGLIAARVLRVPFVYQCLDPYAASLPEGWSATIAKVVHRVENLVIGAADLFVITDLRRMPQHEGARPREIVELPNLPMQELQAQAYSGGDLVVAYIGSLVPHRALDVLVETVGAMEGEGVRLVLGGFGVLEGQLQRQASTYPNIDFLGPVAYDETLRILGHADVLVQLGDPNHSGLRWVSPNKVFESMWMSRPIIVAEGTLAAERATESGHGVTVRYGDADDLRQALIALLKDRDGAALLGARGRSTAERLWSPRALSETVLDAYDRLLTHSPR